MNSRDWLLRTVGRVRRTEMTWWAVRLASVAAGLGALAQLANVPGGWLWSLAFVPIVALWNGPDGHAAARRMDRAAGLDGEVECAWDHRDQTADIHVAQRDRARRHFARGLSGRVVPLPHLAWFAPALIWFAVTETPGTPSMGQGTAQGEMAAAPPGEERARVSPTTSPKSGAVEKTDRAVASSTPRQPADGPMRNERRAGGERVAGTAKTGGVGAQAGDRQGGRAGRREVALGGHPTDSIPLDAPSGAGSDGARSTGRALAGRTPPPPDAIADPARRYPRRYHTAIARWFDRDRE